MMLSIIMGVFKLSSSAYSSGEFVKKQMPGSIKWQLLLTFLRARPRAPSIYLYHQATKPEGRDHTWVAAHGTDTAYAVAEGMDVNTSLHSPTVAKIGPYHGGS